MIQSMTGYGRGLTGKGAAKVSVLIKAVNGRFLDVKIRGIDLDPSDDKKIRDVISEKLVRGTIHLSLEIEVVASHKRYHLIKIDLKLLKLFYSKFKKIMDVI